MNLGSASIRPVLTGYEFVFHQATQAFYLSHACNMTSINDNKCIIICLMMTSYFDAVVNRDVSTADLFLNMMSITSYSFNLLCH